MSDQIDLNAVAADVSVKLVQDACREVFSRMNGLAKSTYKKLFPGFEEHLLGIREQISVVKIITSQDIPVKFTQVYTSSKFKCGEEIYEECELIDAMLSGKRCVLMGNGGAGKTFMMKNIWLEVFRRNVGEVPILVELRKLNSLSTYDIVSFIRLNFFGKTEFDDATFKHFCEQGVFTFLLDGFDEVTKEKREDLEKQILELSRRFPKCGMIVSGRHDERFKAWKEFYIFRSEPFGYDQFRDLISKVPFDHGTKKAFLKVASAEFFEKHNSFLSNPLLSLMMLLTYRDNAEIPSRLSTFYERCFSTLYAQHDALKESFSREKSLDQLRFKKLFSAFSLITYLDSKPNLNESDFIQAIEKAKGVADINVGVDDARHDILESVNLLIKEADNYYYIHRSFQEFFAANCVVSVLSTKQGEMISRFAKRNHDATIALTYELHQKLVEDEVIVPRYQVLKKNGNLPQKISRSYKYNAISASGFSVHVVLKRFQKHGDPKIRYAFIGCKPSWDDDYEVLVSTMVAVMKDRTFSSLTGMAVVSVLIPLVHKFDSDLGGDVFDHEAIDFIDEGIFSFDISYSADSIIVTSADGRDAEDTQESDWLEGLIKEEIENISLGIEKKLLDVNKLVVKGCESILIAQDKHKNILDDL